MDLNAEEQRVLGALIEKSLTRPDDYPLTLNALVAACNQTTNRDPVVHYDELTVERALAGLREQELARRGVYAGSRVPKHRHSADETLTLNEAELAVLSVLLLRGPQTPGELKVRTERAHVFVTLAELDATIDALASRTEPLVERLDRQPGQKEARIRHLLYGTSAVSEAFDDDGSTITPVVNLASAVGEPRRAPDEPNDTDRIDALEHEVRFLRREVAELWAVLRSLQPED